MIAYYFPPMGTVGVFRNFMMHRCFSGIFEKVFTISINNITIAGSGELMEENAAIHRVYNWDYRNIMNFLSGKDRNLRKSINTRSNSIFVRFFRKTIESFPCNTIIGEGGILYIINGTLKGRRLIRRNNITHIYSSFRPLADHIIAYNLKLMFPKLKWIADFRDLPVDQYRKNTIFPAFQWKIIRMLMSRANIKTTVSEGLKRRFIDKIGKTEVLLNGIYEIFKPSQIERRDKFTILYTGSLYPEFGKPSFLFEALRSLLDKQLISDNSFSLEYAGKDSLVWNEWIAEYGLNEISCFLGELTSSESVKFQFSSHILLLVTWAGEEHTGILTGKLFEYLATENPILAVINGEKDPEIETIFDDLNAGNVFYEGDRNTIEEFILMYYTQWLNTGKTSHSPCRERFDKHSWNSREKQLKELLGYSENHLI